MVFDVTVPHGLRPISRPRCAAEALSNNDSEVVNALQRTDSRLPDACNRCRNEESCIEGKIVGKLETITATMQQHLALFLGVRDMVNLGSFCFYCLLTTVLSPVLLWEIWRLR